MLIPRTQHYPLKASRISSFALPSTPIKDPHLIFIHLLFKNNEMFAYFIFKNFLECI